MVEPITIGIICNKRLGDIGLFQAVHHSYLHAIATYMRAVPLLIPAALDDTHSFQAEAILDKLDGLLLTGNRTNVHPRHYGRRATSGHEPFDTQRDRASFALLETAMQRDLPVLGVCRGLQELNVMCGGSLASNVHLDDGVLDHQTLKTENLDAMYAARHDVRFTENGYFHKLLGIQEARINSLHSQAIDQLGNGLTIEARADDNIIEAVRHCQQRFCVGVQWHPEYQTGDNQISEKLFADFEHHARERKA